MTAHVLEPTISNAPKLAPADSAINLRAERASPGTPVCITVQDAGSGIPEQFKRRLFERFAQADMNTTLNIGGSGLGLPIVKATTEQMVGSVSYESKPRQTVFGVSLPGAPP